MSKKEPSSKLVDLLGQASALLLASSGMQESLVDRFNWLLPERGASHKSMASSCRKLSRRIERYLKEMGV